MTLTALALLAVLPAQPEAPASGGAALEAIERPLRPVQPPRAALFGVRWRQPVIRTGGFRTVSVTLGSPAISGAFGLVLVGTGEGEVRAVSLANGRIVWRYDHGVAFQAAPVIVNLAGQPEVTPDEVVVIGGRDGTLLALDVPTGELRWKATLEGDPRAPARRAGDRLLVATAANKVFALDVATGAQLWASGRPQPTGLSITGVARPFEHDGVVYASFADGYVEAYRLDDGTTLWSRPLSFGRGEFVDADADPLVHDGKLFVASYADGIYALDPVDGETLWKRDAPAVVSLARHRDVIVAASADGWVWGLASADGEIAYRTRLSPGPVSRILVHDELLMMTAGEIGLVILDGLDGKPLQATPVGDTAAGAPAWAGSDVAVLSSTGFLYTLRLGVSPLR